MGMDNIFCRSFDMALFVLNVINKTKSLTYAIVTDGKMA